jgi:hypothetical protein
MLDVGSESKLGAMSTKIIKENFIVQVLFKYHKKSRKMIRIT